MNDAICDVLAGRGAKARIATLAHLAQHGCPWCVRQRVAAKIEKGARISGDDGPSLVSCLRRLRWLETETQAVRSKRAAPRRARGRAGNRGDPAAFGS